MFAQINKTKITMYTIKLSTILFINDYEILKTKQKILNLLSVRFIKKKKQN